MCTQCRQMLHQISKLSTRDSLDLRPSCLETQSVDVHRLFRGQIRVIYEQSWHQQNDRLLWRCDGRLKLCWSPVGPLVFLGVCDAGTLGRREAEPNRARRKLPTHENLDLANSLCLSLGPSRPPHRFLRRPHTLLYVLVPSLNDDGHGSFPYRCNGKHYVRFCQSYQTYPGQDYSPSQPLHAAKTELRNAALYGRCVQHCRVISYS